MKAVARIATLAAVGLSLAAAANATLCPGPDLGGYVCASSPSCGFLLTTEKIYDFPGTDLFEGDLDDGCETRTLPFTFTHYGVPFNSVGVGTNGYLVAGGCINGEDFSNDCPIPNAFTPNNIIAGFWDDLYLAGDDDVPGPASDDGQILDGVSGTAPFRVYSVSYIRMPDIFPVGPRATFQIQIHENGGCGALVRVVIDTVTGSGWSPTQGLENATGTIGIMSFCSSTDTAISPSCNTFSVTPTNETPSQCHDGLDNDCDGLTDCEDGADCLDANPENCDNLIDDDCDGGADCDDVEGGDCDSFFKCRLFAGIDAIRDELADQGAAIDALETKLDAIQDADCEIIRLLHTPSGQRSTTYCGGYTWPAGQP